MDEKKKERIEGEEEIKYSFSEENEEVVSEEVRRVCESAPVAEILLENYLNSIFLFFGNLEKEYEVSVIVESDRTEIRPKASLLIKVRSHFKNEREIQEATTALVGVINETLDRIKDSKISEKAAVNTNQKIQLEVNKL